MVAAVKSSKAARFFLILTSCAAVGAVGFFGLIAGGYDVGAAPEWLPFDFSDDSFVANGTDEEGRTDEPTDRIGGTAGSNDERIGFNAEAQENVIEVENKGTEAPNPAGKRSTTTTTTAPEAAGPPEIAVTSPAEGTVFQEKIITFAGVAEAGSEVYVGPYKATIDGDGNWHIELTLAPGNNTVTFKVIDADGNIATTSVTVVYDPPVTTTTAPAPTTTSPPAPVEIAFSANQKYGSCDLEDPYDIFWGTAPPGSAVVLSSEFGSATVSANANGDWEKKVYFVGIPEYVEFPITVTGVNGSANFSFIHNPPEEPVDVAFSVETYYPEVNNEPVQKFHGTATPWSTVTMASDYGTVTATANGWGEWGWTYLNFVDLPADTPITVTVIAENGTATFPFKWIPEASN